MKVKKWFSDKFYEDMERIISDNVPGAPELTEDFEICQLDSLARAEVIVAAEEHIGCQLTNDEILNGMKTFNDLQGLMLQKCGAAQ